MTPEQHRQVTALVDATVAAGFSASRMPRSDAYREGVRGLLLLRATNARLLCPWRPGTAECDAFFAGVEEGKDWWRHQVEKMVADQAAGLQPGRHVAGSVTALRKAQAREAMGLYPRQAAATVLHTGSAG